MARLFLRPWITNVQMSWVKMGPKLAQLALCSGANDFGGTLMEESISRESGADFGENLPAEEMRRLIREVGRTPVQRSTTYQVLRALRRPGAGSAVARAEGQAGRALGTDALAPRPGARRQARRDGLLKRAQPGPRRRPVPWHMLVRDLLFVGLTLALWRLDATLRDTTTGLSVLVAVAAGALAAISGYLAHEWGHLIGARISGGVVHFPKSVVSTFLFYFDTKRSDRRQFLAMSLGGFAASAVVTPLLILGLPAGAISTYVALVLIVAGLIATAWLELPLYFRVLRGAPLPRGVVFRSDAQQGA